MSRVNVYLPDELAARARAAELNLSAVTREAVQHRLAALSTDTWLDALPGDRAAGRAAGRARGTVDHDRALAALDAARDDAPTRHG